jgi:hypothetical protein
MFIKEKKASILALRIFMVLKASKQSYNQYSDINIDFFGTSVYKQVRNDLLVLYCSQ